MTHKNAHPLATLATVVATAWVANAQPGTIDYEQEIQRVRKELISVQEETARTVEEREKDAAEFQDYRKRALKRLRGIRQETDSIKQEVQIYTLKNDSLGSLVEKEKVRKRQYELGQDQFRNQLIAACTEIEEIAEAFPPNSATKSVSALNLLKNDLNTKSVDNVEGINRLFQIIGDMHEATATIQIVQGSSPIPDIRGTTYRLRLGTFFEAVVNAQGTRAALWTGWGDDGNPTWKLITDAAVASNVLKAVNVREGKALPSLVELPLQDIAVVKGEKKTDE